MSKIYRVKDVMVQGVVYIDGMATIDEAASSMRSSKVSELLVSKRSPDDAWGLVTVQDIVREVIEPGRKPKDVFAYEVMSKPAISVPAEMDIRYAIRLLLTIGISHAPVESNGEMVGMLTMRHLILNSDIFMDEES